MKSITLDLETYSSVNLAKSGVYVYAESSDFEILLLSYSIDGGPVQIVDMACGEKIPPKVMEAIQNPEVTKHAFNANFERVCLSFWLNKGKKQISDDDFFLDPAGWHCDMVWAGYLSLPMSLEKAGAVLNVKQQKMKEGKDLIRYFSVPCKPTKTNGYRTRNLPEHEPKKWETFKAYNKRDVETEMAIQKRLSKAPVPDFVWDEYVLDQRINDRGVLIDMELVENALMIDEKTRNRLLTEMGSLTMLENPNSVSQLKDWLAGKGYEVESLGKKQVQELMETAPKDIAKVLSLRLQTAKSSIRKYEAMKNCVNTDGRARGLFKFYGANRSGRWAGSRLQIQNLRRNEMQDLEQARALVKSRNLEALELLYDSVPEVLSELVRTALIPKLGMKFIVADFSAIEARVLSWLAWEKWRMETFANGGDIYCATASKMFHCNVVKHGENGELRQKGKQAELACIAAGSLVHTNHGLCRIQDVQTSDKVWDGQSWVRHHGVIAKGFKTVITYGGLTATPDHLVYPYGFSEPVPFLIAAMLQIPLTEAQNNFSIQWDQRYTYDLFNCGRNHRFLVSGVLVHNCGYGGSVGAMKAMGALEMGMKEEELKPLVDAWREANPKIVELWWHADSAVKKAIETGKPVRLRGLTFRYEMNILFIDLQSGRSLSYVKPRIEDNDFGGESITYMGTGGTKKWERIESYGPKFVENIVQAIARDLLVAAMQRMGNARIVAHIHDEMIVECQKDASVEDFCRKMNAVPDWADGLLLNSDGYCCEWYKKD